MPAKGAGQVQRCGRAAQSRVVDVGYEGDLVDGDMCAVDESDCLLLRMSEGKQVVTQFEGGENSGVAG
jgi:hypothetical protein